MYGMLEGPYDMCRPYDSIQLDSDKGSVPMEWKLKSILRR